MQYLIQTLALILLLSSSIPVKGQNEYATIELDKALKNVKTIQQFSDQQGNTILCFQRKRTPISIVSLQFLAPKKMATAHGTSIEPVTFYCIVTDHGVINLLVQSKDCWRQDSRPTNFSIIEVACRTGRPWD